MTNDSVMEALRKTSDGLHSCRRRSASRDHDYPVKKGAGCRPGKLLGRLIQTNDEENINGLQEVSFFDLPDPLLSSLIKVITRLSQKRRREKHVRYRAGWRVSRLRRRC